jgi:rhodanese-related sulfurtransferase
MERSVKPQGLALAGKYLIDVRRKEDREASPEQLPCATWHDPSDIAHWRQSLPKDKEIVLYCVRGGSVSNSVVDALQAQGLNACFIEGGIEGWRASGGQVVPKG